MSAPYEAPEGCDDWCPKMAAAQLLGPLQPNASICVHGHRYVLSELFPRDDV